MRATASLLTAFGLLLGLPAAAQPPTDTLAAVRERGVVTCGVTPSTLGFAAPDSNGVWRGMDVDYCRAIAAAVFGDASRTRFVTPTTQTRFPVLQSGEIDVLLRTTTWTLGREATLGVAFAGVNMFDGQGFMVKRYANVRSVRQLDGKSICLLPGTTTESITAEYFRTHGMSFTPVRVETIEALRDAFVAGRCDVFTLDVSALAAFRASQGANAEQYVILPEIVSKEPLGPVVRQGDWRWFNIVRWTHHAMIAAEEMGLTSANIDARASASDPDVQRFVGTTGDLGRALGLDNRWAAEIVKQVGNYGELWERNITPIGVERSINNLWTNGGLHYAPPMR
ncbi:amino acid ABC transporter substrate-binding protein [Falsiroseomonas oryziterrae]|uniref:amino acid ABC transporter substrate-binding protein n=1 Tax=Falsiroseomonas oryziterrae TaxID=2911368 RepID=UPI001F2AEC70|nr:amino acid ABC transporter substrate-binding protein [Roseomonas sp. NPKOSM-4]